MGKKAFLLMGVMALFFMAQMGFIIGDQRTGFLCNQSKYGGALVPLGILPPELVVDPTSHDFGDICIGNEASTTFEIYNGCGCGTLEYTIVEGCDWVDVHPTYGTSVGEHDIITVDIDTKGLSLGGYICNVFISSNGGNVNYIVIIDVVDIPNNPPGKPSIEGTTYGLVGNEYLFAGTSHDPEGQVIYYNFSWGDETCSGWLGPYNSGQTCMTTHSWEAQGTYPVKVKVRDEKGKESEWSDSLSVSMPKVFHKIGIIDLLAKLGMMIRSLVFPQIFVNQAF